MDNKLPGSWTVVKFITDNSVEAVPTKWISQNNLCLWPPFTAKKIMIAIRREDIDTCWPTYKVDVFKDATYDQYDMARSKAKRAEETSDLNSEIELKKDSRRKKPNNRYFPSSSDEENERPLNKLLSIKSPPKLLNNFRQKKLAGNTLANTPKMSRGIGTILDFEEQASAQENSQHQVDDPNLDLAQDSNENGFGGFIPEGEGIISSVQDVNQNSVPALGTTPTPGRLNKIDSQNTATTCTCCPVHAAYLKMILKSQQTNRSILVELLEQTKIQTRASEQAITSSVFDQFILPVNTIEDLLTMDNYLKTDEVFPKAVLELTKLGGKNNYEVVRRILVFFLTNEVGSKYSFLGRREKGAFKSLEIARLIVEVTKVMKMGTVQETEMSVSKWLRRANDRNTGGKK